MSEMAIFRQLTSDKRKSAFEVARPEHFHRISKPICRTIRNPRESIEPPSQQQRCRNGCRVCVSQSRTWNHHLLWRFESLRYFAVAVLAAGPTCPVSIADLGVALVTSANRLVS